MGLIGMYDGIKLKRLTRSVGFSGYSQGKVYTFKKKKGRYHAEGEEIAHGLLPLVSSEDWEVVQQRQELPPAPKGLFIVVSREGNSESYGVFTEDRKAISYMTERDDCSVYKFHETGSTTELTLELADGKLFLVTKLEEEVE